MSLPSGNNTPKLSNQLARLLGQGPLPQLPSFSLPQRANIIEDCGKNNTIISLPRSTDDASLPYILRDENCLLDISQSAPRAEIWRDGDISLRGNNTSVQNNATIHVNGNVYLRGTASLGGHTTSLIVYGNRTVAQTGTADFYGFVFAPQSTFESRGTAKLAGMLWAKDVDLGSNSQGKIFQNVYAGSLTLIPEGTTDLPYTEAISPIISYRSLAVE
jgi:hypothetical protein